MVSQILGSMMISPPFDIIEDSNAHFFGDLPSGAPIVPFLKPPGKESLRGAYPLVNSTLARKLDKG